MKKVLMAMMLAAVAFGAMAQDNERWRENIPKVGKDNELSNYDQNDTGFWIAGEVNGAYSCSFSGPNAPMVEADVVGGYRFGEYIRVGLGFGGRGYINNSHIRAAKFAASFPIFVNARGNIIRTGYNNVVPYWSMSIGGAIRDGFMMRPSIGIRVGQKRSAFIAAITYTGQSLKAYDLKNRFCSFMGLTLGYEY